MNSDSSSRPVAIITGASNGIGKATALLLAERGYDIGFTYRSDQRSAIAVAERARETGAACSYTQLDLENPRNVPAAFESLYAQLGRLDLLVNNAATDHRADFIDDDLEAWERVLNVDLLGAIEMARHAARVFIAQSGGGVIINVTSVLDNVPVSGGSAYCAAKAALELATQVMALELAKHGIRVNAVAPGLAHTPQNFGPDEIDPRAGLYPEIPVGRPAAAREIAEAIAYLASPQASYATGGRLLIDGGLTLQSGPQTLETAMGYMPSEQAAGRPAPADD
jgi:NAD(P)-dependent dehydrogenase (short-subunit alcohol dehydrogenase family)